MDPGLAPPPSRPPAGAPADPAGAATGSLPGEAGLARAGLPGPAAAAPPAGDRTALPAGDRTTAPARERAAAAPAAHAPERVSDGLDSGVPATPERAAADEAADDAADDAALMAAFVAGDAGAFASLYDRHERAVYRFLLRSVGDRGVAEDLLQETFLAVVRNAHGPSPWTPRAPFRAWLYGIARNQLIDHWRARPRWVSVEELGVAPAAGSAAPPAGWLACLAADATTQPERRAEARAQAHAFTTAVEALPAAQREAFLLHAHAGLSIEELAQLTGVGAETAKSRYRYALARLRGAMEDWR